LAPPLPPPRPAVAAVPGAQRGVLFAPVVDDHTLAPRVGVLPDEGIAATPAGGIGDNGLTALPAVAALAAEDPDRAQDGAPLPAVATLPAAAARPLVLSVPVAAVAAVAGADLGHRSKITVA